MAANRFTVRAGFADAAFLFVAERGGSIRRVRAQAGFEDLDFDRNRFVDMRRFGRLYACCAEELSDSCFGLHLGESLGLRTLGAVSYAVFQAPTVETALQNFVRYQSSMIRGAEAFFERKRHGGIGFRLGDTAIEGFRHLGESGAAILAKLLRELVGPAWRPLSVSLEHPYSGSTKEHRRIFGCAPQFGRRRTEIKFAADALERRVPGADRVLLPLLENELTEVLRPKEGHGEWIDALRVVVARLVCDGHPTVGIAADQLAISSRTLQRRLAERGVSYRSLVQGVRKELAEEYLAQTDTSLQEISFLLGYSEVSAFDHAFRRWSGESPTEYRRRKRGAGS